MKTTMYTQWENFKKEHINCVVLFRVGGFYEALEMDAYILRKYLGFKMTMRQKGKGQSIPMVGFPPSGLEIHVKKLMDFGINTIVVEQLEETEESGIKKRGVHRINVVEKSLDLNVFKEKYKNYLVNNFPHIVEGQIAVKMKLQKMSLGEQMLEAVGKLNIDRMGGFDALKFLHEWQKRMGGVVGE